MTMELQQRLAKAFRVRGPGVRSVYFGARRAARYFRDGRRRRAAEPGAPLTTRIPPEMGFLVLPPATFDEVAVIVREARAHLKAYRPDAPPDGKSQKQFLQNVLDVGSLTRDSAVMRLALREELLASVASYLGVAPVLSAISVFLSAGSDAKLKSSQLYHCDGDDVRQVKMFVYCSDVDLASGPLTVLDATSTATVMTRTQYQFRQRLTDEQVEAVIGPHRDHPIVGPAGTVALVDTSRCLHFGSRITPDAPFRLAVMVQYQTPYSFTLPGQTRPFAHLATGPLSPLQQLALTD